MKFPLFIVLLFATVPYSVKCFEFNVNELSVGQLIDYVQQFFSSPFLKTIKGTLSAAIDEECEYKCSNGRYPRRNPHYVVKSNGCGVPGIQMPKIPKYIPLSNLDDCCAEHDICYGTCNKDKRNCDDSFKKCLYNICTKLQKFIHEDYLKGCKVVARTMYTAVTTMGCKYYLYAQKEACLCDDMSYTWDEL